MEIIFGILFFMARSCKLKSNADTLAIFKKSNPNFSILPMEDSSNGVQEVLIFCPHSSQIFYHSKKPSNQNKWRDKTKYQSEEL